MNRYKRLRQTSAIKVPFKESGSGRENEQNQSNQSRRQDHDTCHPPSHQEEQCGQQGAGLMSGDSIHALHSTLRRGEKLDFGESGVVPAKAAAAATGAFTHRVVASHGVSFPQ